MHSLICCDGLPAYYKASGTMEELQRNVTPRLMPITLLGSRAQGAAHKIRRLLHVLGLEGDVNQMVERCISDMSDYGPESKSWTAPLVEGVAVASNLDASKFTLFPNSMPIPDHDHCLHHAASAVLI